MGVISPPPSCACPPLRPGRGGGQCVCSLLVDAHEELHGIHLQGLQVPVLHALVPEGIVEPLRLGLQGLEDGQAVFQVLIACLLYTSGRSWTALWTPSSTSAAARSRWTVFSGASPLCSRTHPGPRPRSTCNSLLSPYTKSAHRLAGGARSFSLHQVLLQARPALHDDPGGLLFLPGPDAAAPCPLRNSADQMGDEGFVSGNLDVYKRQPGTAPPGTPRPSHREYR